MVTLSIGSLILHLVNNGWNNELKVNGLPSEIVGIDVVDADADFSWGFGLTFEVPIVFLTKVKIVDITL